METTVDDVLDKVKKVQEDLTFHAGEAMHDTAKEYVALQQDQMFSGLTESGDSILPAYTKRTVEIKKKKGQPYDRVTLKDTGAFYKDMFLDVRESEFVIDSADPKSGALQKKYGKEIFGLTESNQSDYIDKNLEDKFQQRIQNALEL
jgi:hypothetical protein